MPLLTKSRKHVIAYAALLACLPAANAFEIETDSDVKIRWDNTIKYSAAQRLKNPSSSLTSDPNLDDGDASFRKGIISNRFDLLSELDVTKNDYGMRISAAFWSDSVYKGKNAYAGRTSNATSVSLNEFTQFAKKTHGQNQEILDAFVFGKTTVGESTLTGRLGRHSLQYGETLFFGGNGIAAAQGPIDVVKLLSVPGTQFKEVLRPVEQISTNLQLQPNLSVGGYYQLRWRPSRLPAPGSYFSNVDFAPDGAESIILGPGVSARRGADFKPKDSGQGGMQIRYTPVDSGVDLGFYLARFHDKGPSGLYIVPPGLPFPAPVGLYQAYHEGIKTAGASASTSIGDWNVATEVSVRHNTPLNSNPVVSFGDGNNTTNPLFAVGKSAHANLSGIYVLPKTSLWDGGTLLAELAWHRLTSITSNPISPATNVGALDPGVTRDATAFRLIFEPTYYQVRDGLDISVPIGLGYGLDGRSPLFTGGFSPKGTGDFSIGVKGVYAQKWNFGINAVTYIGSEKLVAVNGAQTYGQSLKDRKFVALNVWRTF